MWTIRKRYIIIFNNIIIGGIVESEVLVDNEGNLHIFLENANGTSPHAHIKYYFDPNATKYVTKADWKKKFIVISFILSIKSIIFI